MPPGDAHHLHDVLNPFLAEAISVGNLVGQSELVIEHIEMPDARVDVLWLHRVTTDKVNAIEILA